MKLNTSLQVALLFPGQGAQKVGMGREFYETSPSAKAIFDQASQILGNDFKSVIFEGPAEKLTQTAFCQPAILTMSVAGLKALEAHPKFQNFTVRFAAGLSLGEYSALVAAGALTFGDALRLVERRAFFMEEAAQLAKGSMAAVIGFDRDRLIAICSETGAEVANFNSPEQIVITGPYEKVGEVCRRIQEEGAKSVLPLEVSGAFHSSLMQPASRRFEGELKKVSIQYCRIPVISNVHAQPHGGLGSIRRGLARQIVSSVRWEESVRYIASQGITDFIEIGPGRVLKGLIRRIDSSLRVFNIEKPKDFESLP